MKTPIDFPTALKQFRAAQNRHNLLAQTCAVMSLQQYIADGNLDPAKQFREALDTTAKQNAFVKWLSDMSNGTVQFSDKKFTKRHDATEEQMAGIDIEKAEVTIMLTYKQEAAEQTYNAATIRKKVEQTLKRFITGQRIRAETDEIREWAEDIIPKVLRVFDENPVPPPESKTATAV